ncbi:RNase P subunit p30 [Methanocorpusculum labreanum Z]|uniref:Ribonuclease P protein component 3 n=1 Tax=Methanocorpusculum labreanum (strain ATCC 43576 / DSM 4855 / Z) TaxID=410358 RepID=A2ST54_METLZ|nr:RNase P subunit p30 family protein [Methanocorpusculum labreanum]ABN07510.1 RNase P subunit p30 [Methanocorpusculum labreanum Z]
MITDACVYANDSSNTTLRRFALTAASCGFSRIIACDSSEDISEYAGVSILKGKMIGRVTGKAFLDAVRKTPAGTVVFVQAGENGFNRTAITTKGVHLLTGIADLPKGGFDHITAKMAAQQNTGVVLDLSRIIDPKTRRAALSRYAEILAFHRKYRFPLLLASGASDSLGQRNIQEVTALVALFGMTKEETNAALSSLDGILYPKKTVEIVEEKS